MLAVGNDNIAFKQSGPLGWAAIFDRDYQDAAFDRQVMEAHHAAQKWNILSRDTNIAARDFSISNEPAGDKLCCIARNSEADTLSRQNNRAVDADYVSARSDKRPT